MRAENPEEFVVFPQSYIEALRFYLTSPSKANRKRLIREAEKFYDSIVKALKNPEKAVSADEICGKLDSIFGEDAVQTTIKSAIRSTGITQQKLDSLEKLCDKSSGIKADTILTGTKEACFKDPVFSSSAQDKIHDAITRLEMQASNLRRRGKKAAAKELQTCVDQLREKTNSYFAIESADKRAGNYASFQGEINQLLEQAERSEVLQKHRGILKPLLLNIGAAIAGLGVVYLVALGVRKVIKPNKSALFLGNTRSVNALQKTNRVFQQALEADLAATRSLSVQAG